MPDQNLTDALNSINTAGGAAQQLAESLLAASRSTSRQATAADVAGRAMESFEQGQNRVKNGMMSMAGTLTNIASSLVNLGTSAYTADKAFTGMLPVLDAVTTTLKGTFDALGKMGSGITVYGLSLGKATEAAAQAANLYVDALHGVLKFQLEAAQSMADRFVQLTKVGAFFGGGLTELRNTLFGFTDATGKVVKGVGLPFQEFTRIVTENVDSLAALGLGLKDSGIALAGMARNIFYDNKALAAMYGSVTDLAKGTADYLSLQAQLGENTLRIIDDTEAHRLYYKKMTAGAAEYLMRQKELAAITGKAAERLKEEEVARRMQLDYALKLSRLGEDAQNNVTEGLEIAGKLFGEDAKRYAEEYFATNGKIITRQNLTYQSMNEEAAGVVANIMQGVNQSRIDFRTAATEFVQAAGPALKNFALSNETFAEINRQANNPIIGLMTSTSSAIIKSLPMIENMGRMFAQIETDRAAITKNFDTPLQAFVEANKQMLTNRMELDKLVIKSMEATVERDGKTVSAMGELVSALYALQRAIIKTMPDAMAAFQKLQSMQEDPKKVIEDFAKKLAQAMGFREGQNTPQLNIPGLPNNQPPQSAPSGPNSTISPSQIPNLNPSDIAPNPSPMSTVRPAPAPAPAAVPTPAPAPTPAPPPAQTTSSISQDLVVALLKETADQNEKLGQLIVINQRTLNAVS